MKRYYSNNIKSPQNKEKDGEGKKEHLKKIDQIHTPYIWQYNIFITYCMYRRPCKQQLTVILLALFLLSYLFIGCVFHIIFFLLNKKELTRKLIYKMKRTRQAPAITLSNYKVHVQQPSSLP